MESRITLSAFEYIFSKIWVNDCQKQMQAMGVLKVEILQVLA